MDPDALRAWSEYLAELLEREIALTDLPTVVDLVEAALQEV